MPRLAIGPRHPCGGVASGPVRCDLAESRRPALAALHARGYGCHMTPDEAAAVLGIRPDADEPDIDRAYRRLARELHPDRYAGASDTDVRTASDRFVDVTRAREVLVKSAALRARTGAAASGSGAAGASAGSSGRAPGASGRRVVEYPVATEAPPERPIGPFSWGLFAGWTVLLVVGALFSFSAGPVWAPVDLWARIVLLVAFALGTAITGRRWVWRVTLALIAVSAVATIVETTVGGLLGLGMMIIASFGLAVQARLVRFPD